ncbi:hypothetical protein N7520_002280 [Penicillium odoratum]|uniref:uncharacterized protein n=1 Tax=Penicillium odoratum TaxID=1167516 RepID=UPI002546EB74|nr:uncharacterized protein N7520_002280 [Penicillium odoratum]KAJ5771751.1 hypothetical protein N7520_002280 [Penicillium odoratum]
MNGPGEYAGGVIILRARALLKEGKLPNKLWPEAVKAAKMGLRYKSGYRTVVRSGWSETQFLMKTDVFWQRTMTRMKG